MITPSFGLTATERVLPKLALDFTTASLDPRVTFTRTGNTATVINSSGYVTPINADLPRFDYNPITLTCNGLLIEESRTNTIIYSEQFDISATWVPSLNISVTANAATSPANTTTADKLINANGASGVSIAQLNSYVSGTTYTYSVFLKAAGDTTFILLANSNLFTDATFRFATFNLSNGTFTLGGGSGATATITAFSNSWYRCTLTFTPSVTIVGAVQLRNNNTGNGTNGVFAWGAQSEVGSFATSYIPTAASQVTRNADVATMTGTNFSDWFNASEGTFVYQGYASPQTPAVYLSAHSGAVANSIFFDNDSGNIRNVVFSGGAPVAVLSTGAIGTVGNPVKLVGAYKVDDFAAVKNNETLAQDLAGAVPVGLDTLVLGGWGSVANAQVNSWVAKVFYYPQRLLNAEMQAFSK